MPFAPLSTYDAARGTMRCGGAHIDCILYTPISPNVTTPHGSSRGLLE